MGVVVDGSGNVGGFVTGGAGPSVGFDAGAGIYLSGSNAANINDYAGPSIDFSVHGGEGAGGSVDLSVAPGGYAEVGVTLGANVGVAASEHVSETVVFSKDGTQWGLDDWRGSSNESVSVPMSSSASQDIYADTDGWGE